jgi:hypothetical protein
MGFDLYPVYKVRYSESGGWHVIVTRKVGVVERFYGFETEAEAMKWAAHETVTKPRKDWVVELGAAKR